MYYVLIILGVYLIVYLLYKRKRDIGPELVVAILFTLFITSYHKYVYEGVNIFLGNINLFPLVLWPLGLVLLREYYEYIGKKFWTASIVSVILILLIEFIGYHFLGIKIADNYPGIWGLDIIHGPAIIHYFYILAGPVYLLVTKYLKTP